MFFILMDFICSLRNIRWFFFALSIEKRFVSSVIHVFSYIMLPSSSVVDLDPQASAAFT
jgi:hypothetical protein